MNQAFAEIDDAFKKLLGVKKQKGWPDNIIWPEEE